MDTDRRVPYTGTTLLGTRLNLELLSPVALHSENLDNTNTENKRPLVMSEIKDWGRNIQDVDHIKFETDRLLHGITRDDTTLSQASVMKDFLRTANEGKDQLCYRQAERS
jgi:hypothetical protein